VDCHLYDGITEADEIVVIFSDYTRNMTNEQIASLLDHYALLNRSGLARASMQEAARRLRGFDPGLIAVLPTPPDKPPLKAEAVPDGC
jgi:hypothetical protein